MKAQPPTPAAAATICSRRSSGVASASRASRMAPLSMSANTPHGALVPAWKYVRGARSAEHLEIASRISYEKVTSGPSMLFTPATHARRAAAGESWGQPVVRNLPSESTPSVLPSQR